MRFESSREILFKLLDDGSFGLNGVDRLRFRADHAQEMATLDSWERMGIIRYESDKYFVTLKGMSLLSDQRSEEFYAVAERIYASLARRYHSAPGKSVLLVEVAEELQLEFPVIFSCAALMSECYLCSQGFSGRHAIGRPESAQITPAESVLTHANFRSCVEKLRSMQTDQQTDISISNLLQPALFPPQIGLRMSPGMESALPSNLAGVLNEVHVAIEHSLLTLASMGLRTIIDMVCLEQVGDIGTFKDKLNALCRDGVVSNKQVDVLFTVVDAGNASAHRGFSPDQEDITTVLGVVELLLNTVYVHPKRAADLKLKTPARTLKRP